MSDRRRGRTGIGFSRVSSLPGCFPLPPHTPYQATAAASGAATDLGQLQRPGPYVPTSSCLAQLFCDLPRKRWVQSVCDSCTPLSRLIYFSISVHICPVPRGQTRWHLMLLFSSVATSCVILPTEITAVFKGLPLCMWLFIPVFAVSHSSRSPARHYTAGQQIPSSLVYLHWFDWDLLQGALPLVPLFYETASSPSSPATAATEIGESSP